MELIVNLNSNIMFMLKSKCSAYTSAQSNVTSLNCYLPICNVHSKVCSS